MNELIFAFHVIFMVGFTLFVLRMGKNALIAFLCLQGIFANLFVVKQIFLFGLTVTCSDVFAIGAILSLNLIQEYYGKRVASFSVKIAWVALLFFVGLTQIHLAYLPKESDLTQAAFETIFSHSLRIVLASLTTFFLVQQFDLRFFSYLRGKFVIRLGVSLFFSQLLDTILFSFLGLYGIVDSLFDIICMSLLIKWVIIFMTAPFMALSKRFVKREISI